MNDLDLIPFRVLLDHVVVPARRHLRKTLLATAVPLALTSVAMAAVQVRWTQVALSPDPDNLDEYFTGLVLIMGISLVTLFIFFMAFSALMVASTDAVAGREVKMTKAWTFVLRPPVFLTLVLTSFFNLLALMMCFFPALYVVPLLSFTVPVMVEEKRFGLDAIRRSIELVQFNPTGRLAHSPWIQTLAVVVVGTLLTYAASMTVQLPFAIAQQILVFRDTLTNPEAALENMGAVFWLQLPASLLGALTTSITWLYTTFGICVLHGELRRRREAPDLVQAIDELARQ